MIEMAKDNSGYLNINKNRLFDTISRLCGVCIFEDPSPGVVCRISGVEYTTLQELASTFGIDMGRYSKPANRSKSYYMDTLSTKDDK